MKVSGIPVSISPFGEKNAMIGILTSRGVVSFATYGGLSITNKNFPSLNLFTLNEYTLNESKKKDGYELKESSIVNSYPGLHGNLPCLSSLQFFEEFLKKIFGSDDCSGMFEYLESILGLLENGFDPLTLVIIFIAVGLKKSGYGLDVDNCVVCGGKKAITSLSFDEGGFICVDCKDDFSPKMSAEKLKCYRYVFLVGFKDLEKMVIEREIAKEMFNELIEYTYNQTGVYLKSADLIKKSL